MQCDEGGSDPRGRWAFDISSVSVGGCPVDVIERTIWTRPFANLIAFSRAEADQIKFHNPINVLIPEGPRLTQSAAELRVFADTFGAI